MKEITLDELQRKLAGGEDPLIVDIRETDEYEGWHIPGSKNVPVYQQLRQGVHDGLTREATGLPRDRSLVTVCRGGFVSQKAASVLESLGYDVASLTGGMRGWSGAYSVAEIAHPSREGATVLQIRRNGKGCLSYLVGAAGEAMAVDPCVDAAIYQEIAQARGLRIAAVCETHVHADHISRARLLCEMTGAALRLPRNERVSFSYEALSDGDRFEVGGIGVSVHATPGHTGESVCYAIDDFALLSGDTLFVDKVGRPDLEKGDAGAEAGAHALHASLRQLLSRFEEVRVLPAHHGDPIGFDGEPVAGSLAEMRRQLPLLSMDESTFVEAILQSLQPKPPNHEQVIGINEGKVEPLGLDPLDLEAGPNRCAAG